MSNSHSIRDLIILSSSKGENISEAHDQFSLRVAVHLHEIIQTVVRSAHKSDACAPCALMSMTATLMGNIFLAFETETGNPDASIANMFHEMVEHAMETAKEHRKIMNDFDDAESKLAKIYVSRGE